MLSVAPSVNAGEVTLDILNTPEPNGRIVVVSGEYVQLELTVDDPTGLSANDTIHLLGTNGQVVDQKRRANSTSFMLRASSDEAVEVFVEYIANGQVIATAPTDPSTPIVVVADLVTLDLMQRVMALEELCVSSDIAAHAADPNAHHVPYTDADAVAAVGPHFSGDHADLTNVQPDQHHEKTPASGLDSVATVQDGNLNGVPGPHVIVEANLHVVDGTGTTTCSPTGCNGLGNLFLGYNEADSTMVPCERAGSHNLIIGSNHRYSSWAGLVAGFSNTISDSYASVTGGSNNTASGYGSAVSGGEHNLASGMYSSVSGGGGTTAA